jgi:hypothetical protein
MSETASPPRPVRRSSRIGNHLLRGGSTGTATDILSRTRWPKEIGFASLAQDLVVHLKRPRHKTLAGYMV